MFSLEGCEIEGLYLIHFVTRDAMATSSKSLNLCSYKIRLTVITIQYFDSTFLYALFYLLEILDDLISELDLFISAEYKINILQLLLFLRSV